MKETPTTAAGLAESALWHEVVAAVDARAEHSIATLQELLRRPSVSATGEGVAECGRWLVEWLRSLGIASELLGSPDRPVVHGQLPSPAPAPTLLVYTHYDVQPVEPLEAWDHAPFDAVRTADRIVARGATDAKGNLAAHVLAVDILRGVLGECPVGLRYLLDGEEEIGSPSLPGVVREHRERLIADGAVSFDGGIGEGDRPKITLGGKGILHLELRVAGPARDLHSSKAALVTSPAWRLVEALASLRDRQGRVAVDGFYAGARPPDERARRLLADYPWDDDVERAALGVEEFIGGVEGLAALERLLYEPTCNISGLTAGYAGEGVKTVLPSTARAKLDLRLVPDQDPLAVFDLVKRHLACSGFSDVEVSTLGHVEPSLTVPDSPLVDAVARAGEVVYGMPPAIKPIVEASGRQAAWLGTVLGMPGVQTGIGPPRWNGHAPNEFITIRHFIAGIKYACAVYLLAGRSLRRGDGT